MATISAKVQPVEINVNQSSSTIYPSLSSSFAHQPKTSQQFTGQHSLAADSSNLAVPTVTISNDQRNRHQESKGDQADTSGQQQPPASKFSAKYLKARMSQFGTQIKQIPSRMGSWAAFFDPKQFSVPANWREEFAPRFSGNLSYFAFNYAIITFILMLYCMITSPLLLLLAAIYGLLVYSVLSRNQDITLAGQVWSSNHQLIILTICFIPFFILFGLSAVFFWLIGATTCVIVLHSFFHNVPQLAPADAMDSGYGGDGPTADNNETDGSGFRVISL